jgi:DNA replication protein DnaC
MTEPLSKIMAETKAALEERWAKEGPTDDRERQRELVRRERQASLENVRQQVPLHCRGPRAELVARIDDKFFRAVHSWAWGDPNQLLLGTTGKGKTTAAAYLLRRLCAMAIEHGGEALERSKLIRWQSCRELSAVVREFPLGEGTPETIQRCQNARLLILDDLGASDERAPLERVMDVRYMRGWPTITTSGIHYRQLVTTLGEHLVRRLVDCRGQAGVVLQVFATQPAGGAP